MNAELGLNGAQSYVTNPLQLETAGGTLLLPVVGRGCAGPSVWVDGRGCRWENIRKEDWGRAGESVSLLEQCAISSGAPDTLFLSLNMCQL